LNPIRMRNEIMRETLRKEILLVSEIKWYINNVDDMGFSVRQLSIERFL
jgi:hypothetical protein